MQAIRNNPYRITGLLVGATAREQARQIKRLRSFLQAEQMPEDDFSFPVLGNLHRTMESVSESVSYLNLDRDKMHAALFWFYMGNAISDEPAFDSLKEGDPDNSLTLWRKLTSKGAVTQRNSSAFQNLSTLLLCNAFNSSTVNRKLLEQGIALKLKFLESDFVSEFSAIATDDTYQTTKKELQLLFLRQVKEELEKLGDASQDELLELIGELEFTAKKDFLQEISEKPIQQIERKVEEAKSKRKANKAGSLIVGKALYKQTAKVLAQLKSVLGASSIKFAAISDKVSEEILQCGIDYFLHYRDSNTDPGDAAMALFQKASILAVGNIVKQRCQENTENLQEWIDNKPERDRQRLIEADLKFITAKLETFQTLTDNVSNAKKLVDSCKPKLSNIKKTIGSTDDFYLTVSSAVVGAAQGMLVTAVNEAQEGFKRHQTLGGGASPDFFFDSDGKMRIKNITTVSLPELSTIVNQAYDVTTSMQSMDMTPNLKAQFVKNRAALSDIRSQINSVTSRTSSSTSSSSNDGGCYIATMVYGDYDHPQVLILRAFRDEFLDKSLVGKWFIKTYYRYSPALVDRLKGNQLVNRVIRITLNQIVKLIRS